MLWSFRALTAFSSNSPSLRPSQDKYPSKPLRDASNGPLVTVTRPDFREGNSSERYRSCQCGYQQADFCPYCDHAESVRDSMVLSVVDLAATSFPESTYLQPTFDARFDSPGRRRKLRKVKPDYQKIRHYPASTEIPESPRPESVFSTHSRTPLLNPSLPSNTNYPPLPERRTPNKLEKRDRRGRSTSLGGIRYSSFGLPSADGGSKHIPNAPSKSALRTKSSPIPKSSPGSSSPRSSSIGTDALVSLAWTGEAQSAVNTSVQSQNSSQINLQSNLSQVSLHSTATATIETPSLPRRKSDSFMSRKRRQSFLKFKKPKEADFVTVQAGPPWSLAMVIIDDKITDEKLVENLEDMRIKDTPPSTSQAIQGPPPDYQSVLNDSYAEYPPEVNEILVDDPITPSDLSWNAARQALLICRELVRTERRYLSSLKTLAKGGTATYPPFDMLIQLPGLIRASEGLLQAMTKNPSVQGVSEAYLANEEQTEEAFISWSSVVGSFFHTDTGTGPQNDTEDGSHVSRSVGQTSASYSTPTSMRGLSVDSSLTNVPYESNKIRRNAKGRPSVRDLAILPTQRIMRHVLLFKQLYTLTPPNVSSFPIIEDAFLAAQSIAQRSDEAQEHSAFH